MKSICQKAGNLHASSLAPGARTWRTSGADRQIVPVAAGPVPRGCLTVSARPCNQSPWHLFLCPSTQAPRTAAGMSCPRTDPHTSWSCPEPGSSKLWEGERKEINMGFLPRITLPSSLSSSPCWSQHLSSQESNLALPADAALTLLPTPPTPLFFSLDNLLWPEWHPPFAFSPRFSALGDRLWAGPECRGGEGGPLSPAACHSGRWRRGLLWIAPVSLTERTLQLCYVLDCTWLMPFFCRLQAGHSCFFKEEKKKKKSFFFFFLGRKNKTQALLQGHGNIVSMYLILHSIIGHDQSSSCFSLLLFLVNQIMFKNEPGLGLVLLEV